MSGTKLNPFAEVDGKRTDGFSVKPEDLVIIGLDTNDGPEHGWFDERILIPLTDPQLAAMVANVRTYGVREPVITGKLPDGRVVVVDGRQRVRCAREANLQAIAAGEEPRNFRIRVEHPNRGGDDLAEQQAVTISLNEIRRDDDVLVKAAKARRLIAGGRTVGEVAVMFGVSNETVRGWAALDASPKELRKAVKDRVISPTAATSIAKTSTEEEIKEKVQEARTSKTNGHKVTAAEVIDRNRIAKSTTEAAPVPGKRALRRIVDGGKETLPAEFIRGVRFCLGELEARSVAGLTAIIEGRDE